MQNPNHEPEYLLRELRLAGLADEDKARLRVNLSAYADFHTAEEPRAVAPRGALAWVTRINWYVPTAAVLVILLAGGTTYASEDSLPGQTLYMVKVRIAEPVALVLATTQEKRAEVHSDFAGRRLEEAAKLAVANELDTGTQAYLEHEFSGHVDGSLAAAETLEMRGKVDEALDVRTGLEARLVAHAEILDLVEDRLEEAGESSKVAHESTQNLIEAVELRQEVVTETRLALERRLGEEATPAATLARVTQAAENAPTAARAAFPPSVAEHADDADDALTAAKEALDDDRPQQAFHEAQEAKKSTEVVSTLLEYSALLMVIDPAATTTPATTTPPVSTTTPRAP